MSIKSRRPHSLIRCAKLMEHVNGDNLVGVEVGVFGGAFSSALLDTYPQIKKLYGVDPYSLTTILRPGWDDAKCDSFYKDVCRDMAHYGERHQLIRIQSVQAGFLIPNELDFAYLDGDHTISTLNVEIPMYEKKVKVGGILAGHDYGHPSHPEVKIAVDTYARMYGRELHTDHSVWMWWWRV